MIPHNPNKPAFVPGQFARQFGDVYMKDPLFYKSYHSYMMFRYSAG